MIRIRFALLAHARRLAQSEIIIVSQENPNDHFCSLEARNIPHTYVKTAHASTAEWVSCLSPLLYHSRNLIDQKNFLSSCHQSCHGFLTEISPVKVDHLKNANLPNVSSDFFFRCSQLFSKWHVSSRPPLKSYKWPFRPTFENGPFPWTAAVKFLLCCCTLMVLY